MYATDTGDEVEDKNVPPPPHTHMYPFPPKPTQKVVRKDAFPFLSFTFTIATGTGRPPLHPLKIPTPHPLKITMHHYAVLIMRIGHDSPVISWGKVGGWGGMGGKEWVFHPKYLFFHRWTNR